MAKMLILRSAGIGDVAMAVHAVRTLRRMWPDLGIVVATKPRMFPFFDGIPGLEFIAIGRGRGATRKLIREARAAGVTCVADLRNELRGKLVRLAFALRGTPTAGYRQRKWERRPLLRRHRKRITWLRNNVLRFCDVFARLGYPVPVPDVPPRARQPIPEAFGPRTGSWAGLAPFAASALKVYPEERRTALLDRMAARFDRVFLFSGPGAELAYAERMAARHPNVIPVFGKTDLSGEVALMSNLDVIVTMDSAAMHMASLSTAPFLTLWGATHPAVGYSAWGAVPERDYIQHDLPCRPCSVYGEGRCRYGNCPCLQGIAPEEVMAKLEDRLR